MAIKIKNTKKQDKQMYKVVSPPHLYIGLEKNELMLKTFLMMAIIAFFSVIVMWERVH
ncbi:MAG: hypothetical protein GF311_19030 [Candidatus Lokiarchaeota archaeon]|nr:hypothetical protein [Candidatus Lokiarchaeota archaeon]